MGDRVWNLQISFEEDEYETRADAWLRSGDWELNGVGRAKRNPADPQRPVIGEELAAARAISEVTHRLVDRAAEAIEAYEGHEVQLHV